MHFFYGLGAFVSPMIASPFLLNIDCSKFIDGYTAVPAVESSSNVTITVSPQPRVVNRATHLSHSKEAFLILGAIQVNLFDCILVYRPFPRMVILFPDGKKDSFKLKEFAEDNFKIDECGREFSKRVENTEGKGEIVQNTSAANS